MARSIAMHILIIGIQYTLIISSRSSTDETKQTSQLSRQHVPLSAHCIAVKSSVLQGMFVCFDKEVGWCIGIAVILVVGREWWDEAGGWGGWGAVGRRSPKTREGYQCLIPMMPKCEGYQYQGGQYREGGMLIPRKGWCQYEERRDTDAKGCDTERPGMKILRESDADAKWEWCWCRALPGNNAYNTTAISVTG
jgi:hypothetical protein